MATRIHLVLAEEEKARLERAAKREGKNLSEWIREAAREKLEESSPEVMESVGDLRAFFEACDGREKGEEPEWEDHEKVIEASRGEGT